MSNKTWCIRCKDVTYPRDIIIEKSRSGYPIAKGVCPTCGSDTRKILSKKEEIA
jgi:Zn finger protein HypA/HybF involved in hydrogenase expression